MGIELIHMCWLVFFVLALLLFTVLSSVYHTKANVPFDIAQPRFRFEVYNWGFKLPTALWLLMWQKNERIKWMIGKNNIYGQITLTWNQT